MSDPEDPGGTGKAGTRGDHLHPVAITDEQSLAVEAAILERTARAALVSLAIPSTTELSVALVTPEAIAKLKGRSLGQEVPTDVLSFPMDGRDGPMLGDVVICPSIALEQARGLGRTLDEEMSLLVVHGVLHLSGLDHSTPSEEISMHREERRILAEAR